ncbi:MAG: NADH:ubiquinone oxidoreductase subunit N, partial [Comamonas sp.]
MLDQLSWIAIYPDLLLLVMACVILLVDLSVTGRKRTPTYALTLVSLVVVAILQAYYAASGDVIYGWGNMVVSDPMGNWLKCFATVATGVALVYGRN